MKSTASFLTSLLFGLLGAVQQLSAQTAEKSMENCNASADILTVASFNVNYRNRDFQRIEQAIVRSGADCVALQETPEGLEGHLKKSLHDRYPYQVAVGRRRASRSDRLTLLSRFPFKQNESLQSPVKWFDAQRAVVAWNRYDVQILNLHLAPVHVGSHRSPGENIRAFWQSRMVHLKEVQVFASQLDPNLPTVICGDFNSLPTDPTIRYLLQQGFQDSFRTCFDHPEQNPTWQYQANPLAPTARIDYLLYSSSFRVSDCLIDKATGSDHFLIATTLEWATENATVDP